MRNNEMSVPGVDDQETVGFFQAEEGSDHEKWCLLIYVRIHLSLALTRRLVIA
jgi:hypothetical protein